MPSYWRLGRLLLLASVAVVVTAQQSDSATPTATSQSASPTSPQSTPTTTDKALWLWGMASTLLSEYYPSTTIDNVATLSWPDTVVIGDATYNVQSIMGTTATSSPSSTQQKSDVSTSKTSTAAPTATSTKKVENSIQSDHANSDDAQTSKETRAIGDKKLGIILGCVIGAVALLVMGVIFVCLKRRKDDTGSFFQGRRTPSNASTAIKRRSWLPGSRSSGYGPISYVSAGASNPDAWEKGPQMTVRPQMGEPRMSQHPAFAGARQHRSSRSASEENPFYTPAERIDAQLGRRYDLERGSYDPEPAELDSRDIARRDSIGPLRMMGFGASRTGPPSQQVERRDFGEDAAYNRDHATHPFSSPSDEEDDVMSPIIPSRSPDRRYSPMVHYPSWSEVSEFDFHGDGRRGLRNMSSSETDGGDGWHPAGERRDGRYELA